MPGRLVKKTWVHDPTIYAPAKYKRACHYEAFVPQKLGDMRLTLDAEVAGVVSEAENAIQQLNATAGPELDPLARLLLRTESIASSKVEGLQLGVRELARAEARVDDGGRASQTAMEVLANIDAMMVAIHEASIVSEFGIAQIAAIHQRLLAPDRPKIAGRVRTQQNWIGGNDYNPCGADFVPPPPDEVDALLRDLCESINSDLLPPLVQAALVHAQFETIHPFEDGNGRTGRALVHVVLKRRNVAPRYLPPISVALANAKGRYIAGLTAFRADGVGQWIEYFAGATARSARLAAEYVKATHELMKEWRLRLSSLPEPPRSDATAWALIDLLPAHPVITASAAVGATGRATGRVYDAIRDLEAAGVLIPLAKRPREQSSSDDRSRRKRSWEVAGLMQLIERMESGERPNA
jgi:Fic family protein